jgi:hypothetical protein
VSLSKLQIIAISVIAVIIAITLSLSILHRGQTIRRITVKKESLRKNMNQRQNEISYIQADAAAEIDVALMGINRYSLDQLMELAGLAVAQCGTSPE